MSQPWRLYSAVPNTGGSAQSVDRDAPGFRGGKRANTGATSGGASGQAAAPALPGISATSGGNSASFAGHNTAHAPFDTRNAFSGLPDGHQAPHLVKAEHEQQQWQQQQQQWQQQQQQQQQQQHNAASGGGIQTQGLASLSKAPSERAVRDRESRKRSERGELSSGMRPPPRSRPSARIRQAAVRAELAAMPDSFEEVVESSSRNAWVSAGVATKSDLKSFWKAQQRWLPNRDERLEAARKEGVEMTKNVHDKIAVETANMHGDVVNVGGEAERTRGDVHKVDEVVGDMAHVRAD